MPILSKFVYKYNAIPIKNPNQIFCIYKQVVSNNYIEG